MKFNGTRHLGFHTGHHLNWKYHIAHIFIKLSKCIEVIHKTSQLLDYIALTVLQNTIISHYLNNCVDVWDNIHKTKPSFVYETKKAIRLPCKLFLSHFKIVITYVLLFSYLNNYSTYWNLSVHSNMYDMNQNAKLHIMSFVESI